ncbi:hypothetical protein J8L98_13110 [Pseudoalteromonas sp. MMG013]|uniref:Uncharacterized protein n=1 Tax=Pseudoalteromonas aurantia 208 TaxID=1314867 RepID=A0ABR9E600_9GAMM|nr:MULTISPECIES: hypothetical protein [Pseudoalteromonas]MBE0366402.1 hypothetical protein [Pseudoalteromonas aurantia 208]MBQ4846545.1 hypothetical protein [Pseudoalteromonas sp. MMG005]MBQ4852017.1 hypothetical protein [Pseudoalteromonas sp. MMG012]MBQ4862629.1 hypothetical protein [Pseudoalteromonas sp. MMG013]RJE77871.1 hypothetical protein BGP78_07120 [Pseudoalteromonas sp. MSK9-3]
MQIDEITNRISNAMKVSSEQELSSVSVVFNSHEVEEKKLKQALTLFAANVERVSIWLSNESYYVEINW